jgi:hypothetical protein
MTLTKLISEPTNPDLISAPLQTQLIQNLRSSILEICQNAASKIEATKSELTSLANEKNSKVAELEASELHLKQNYESEITILTKKCEDLEKAVEDSWATGNTQKRQEIDSKSAQIETEKSSLTQTQNLESTVGELYHGVNELQGKNMEAEEYILSAFENIHPSPRKSTLTLETQEELNSLRATVSQLEADKISRLEEQAELKSIRATVSKLEADEICRLEEFDLTIKTTQCHYDQILSEKMGLIESLEANAMLAEEKLSQ